MRSNGTKLTTLKTEYSHSLYFKKVLHSFLLLSSLIFLSFLVTIFLLMKKNYRDTLSAMQEQSITQAQTIQQTILKDIHNYAFSLLENSTITRVLYGKEWDVSLALKLQEQYETLMNCSSLIRSAYFINFQTETIRDGYSRTSIYNHPDQDIFELLSRMTPSRVPFIGYPHSLNYTQNGIVRTDSRLLSLIYYQNKSGALVINLSYERYLELVQPTKENYISLIICNKNGQIIASDQEDLFGMDYSESPIYQKIQESSQRNGHFIYALKDSSYDIAYQSDGNFGFCYISILDKRFIYPESRILSFLTHYTFFSVLLVLVISFVISYLIYKPIRHLKEQIADVSSEIPLEAAKEKDEFSYLLENYRSLTQALKKLHDHSLKEQDSKVLKLLLTDNNALSSFPPNKREELSSNFAYKNFRILLLTIDPSDYTTENISETAILKSIVENITQELLAKTYSVLTIDLISTNSIFLLHYNELEERYLMQLLKEAQSFLRQHAKFTFSAGIGSEVEELTELSVSYQSALSALSYRFFHGPEWIGFAAESMAEEPSSQPYPFELDSAIIQAIKMTRPADFHAKLEAFFQEIRSVSINQIISFVMQLNSSIQKLEYNFSIENVETMEYRLLDRFYFSELQELIRERGVSDMAQITEIRSHQSGKKELIERVLVLIEENLYNPNLSVGFIADQIHLSVNYLRNLFKEYVGESLSDYIKKEKLNLICKLLTDTELSLNEISDQLGFTTKNYFFTFFKKHLDMTPSEYRRMHQKKR